MFVTAGADFARKALADKLLIAKAKTKIEDSKKPNSDWGNPAAISKLCKK